MGNWNRGTCKKRFHYQKRCTFRGANWKSKPVCLPTSLLKPIHSETLRSTQIKYPLHWLVFPALEMLCVVFQIIFISPTDALGPPVWFPVLQGCPRGTQAALPRCPWASHGAPITSCTGMEFCFSFSLGQSEAGVPLLLWRNWDRS